MPFNPDTTSTAEVASQPSDWEAVMARLPELEAMFRVGVPGWQFRVGVPRITLAQAYAALRELSWQGETNSWPPASIGGGAATVLVISRSGTTTEAIDVSHL